MHEFKFNGSFFFVCFAQCTIFHIRLVTTKTTGLYLIFYKIQWCKMFNSTCINVNEINQINFIDLNVLQNVEQKLLKEGSLQKYNRTCSFWYLIHDNCRQTFSQSFTRKRRYFKKILVLFTSTDALFFLTFFGLNNPVFGQNYISTLLYPIHKYNLI